MVKRSDEVSLSFWRFCSFRSVGSTFLCFGSITKKVRKREIEIEIEIDTERNYILEDERISVAIKLNTTN